MQYGCIGEKLSHSFSKEIHKGLADYLYELQELTPAEVEDFIRAKEFRAINVTIPYKQTVMPCLDHISDTARKIGAVNTIVNRDGVLYGYNTDFFGMSRLLEKNRIDLSGKKVLILGSGGTSKTALAVAEDRGADAIFRLSRTEREGCITYEQALSLHTDAQVIINTTPCGMYPQTEDSPIDLSAFSKLEAVADAIYNPLHSRLVLQAKERGLKAVGGLYMLVQQAVAAVELFLGERPEEERAEALYAKLLHQKQNLVLIGMPACGKSSVGAVLQKTLNRELADTDRLIEQQTGRSIPDIFKESGEMALRDLESQAVAQLSTRQGMIIATGGGAVLRQENVRALRQNGVLVFLDRPLEQLCATEDRPLSNNPQALEKRYHERYDQYLAAADIVVPVSSEMGIEETAAQVIKEWIK